MSAAEYQYTLSADDPETLYGLVPKLIAELAKHPTALTDVNTDMQQNGLQTYVTINRATAARYGLAPNQVDAVIYDAFGQRTVSTIYNPYNQYFVVMEVAPKYWQHPQGLDHVYLSTAAGNVTGTQQTQMPGRLVSGVTAIQGTSELVTRLTAESLVRNVDKWIFGQHRARALVDLPSATGQGRQQLDGILADIASHDVDAFYIHLAEGQKANPRSQGEFDALTGLNALTAATVVIHGTALTRDQLGHLRDAGAKLVWSPQSNLRLYGETTDVASALEIGLPVALGADWLPSGSPSLLAEITVARRCLIEQGHAVEH